MGGSEHRYAEDDGEEKRKREEKVLLRIKRTKRTEWKGEGKKYVHLN